MHSDASIQDGLRAVVFDDRKRELIELHQRANIALLIKGNQEHLLVLTEEKYLTYPGAVAKTL